MATKTTKTTATERLRQLREAEARERAAARDLEIAAAKAERSRTDARQQLVKATAADDEKAISRAAGDFAKAEAEAENFDIRREAAKLRINQAEQERSTFEATNAAQLLAEIEPTAHAVRDRLQAAVAEVAEANSAWHEVLASVNKVLVADPSSDPAHDLASDHSLAPVVGELRKALRDLPPVGPPLPHFRRRRHQENSELRNRLVKLVGKPRPSDDEQAEIATLRREIGATR